MADYLYFACGWIIRPDVDYFQLRQYADQAKVELVIINPMYRSEEGFMVQTFAVQTPSESELVEFIKTAGADMGLTHWYGVPKEYYERGTRFDLRSVLPYFRDQWLAGMQTYGQHNVSLQGK